jgi:predicted Zn-dependent protease
MNAFVFPGGYIVVYTGNVHGKVVMTTNVVTTT